MAEDIDIDEAAAGMERIAAVLQDAAPKLRNLAKNLREVRDIDLARAEVEAIFSEYQELLNAI